MRNELKPENFIVAMFIRDDGERFVLGAGEYPFKADQLHFVANSIASDVVELQGTDGAIMAGQVARAATQPFDGIVGDQSLAKTQIEELRRKFIAFFQIRHTFTVVYVMTDGSAVQRRGGYLVDAPEVKELYQLAPTYHVALGFEDVNYYAYSEDDQGDPTYSDEAKVANANVAGGGLIWDTLGATFDANGAVFEAGVGGQTTIMLNGTGAAYPVWTVVGPALNPTLANETTGQSMSYDGNVAEGQTLVVDMMNQTAKLTGLSVINDIFGDWIWLEVGKNVLSYTNDSDSKESTLNWNEVLG